MKILPFLMFAAFLSFGCSENSEQELSESELAKAEDHAPSKEEIEANRIDSLIAYHANKFPIIGYTTYKLSNDSLYNNFRNSFGKSKNDTAYRAVITMNRCEFRYMGRGDSIIVPDKIIDDIRAYSVLPQFYPAAEKYEKILVVSNKYQCYGAYENGVLVRFAAANTGKEKTQTYPGRYSLVWKARERISSLNSEWKLPFNFNFHRLAGNAFHQFAMPGRPVSHSCVRQFMDDAEWLFNWGSQAEYVDGSPMPFTGTLVLIIDAFDYSRKKYGPWLDLKSSTFKIKDLPSDPANFMLPFIPLSQVPKTSRGLISKEELPRYKYALDSLYARGILREGVSIIPSVDFNKLREEKAKKAAEKEAAEEKERLEQSKKERENGDELDEVEDGEKENAQPVINENENETENVEKPKFGPLLQSETEGSTRPKENKKEKK